MKALDTHRLSGTTMATATLVAPRPGWTRALARLVSAAGGRVEWRAAGGTDAGADVSLPGLGPHDVLVTGWSGEPGGTSAGSALRRRLKVTLGMAGYAVPPPRDRTGPPHRLVVLRDLVEGVGTGLELAANSAAATAVAGLFGASPDAAFAIGTRSPAATRRLVNDAFDLAERLGAGRLTLVHKGNAVKSTDGLLYRLTVEVGAERARRRPAGRPPQLATAIIDALCAELVLTPDGHDVVLVPALYGDLVEGLCAGLTGRRLRPGALLALGAVTVVEPRLGADPSPAEDALAAVAAALQLLRYVGEYDAADRLDRAAGLGWAAAFRGERSFAAVVDSVLIGLE
jgi:isocitrate dehydrogenase (NAD+)